MEVSERIKKIMDSEGLTASAFADSLGIQRSNVSHIMNGRSGPSLDLLQKILTAFPKYNTDWLVMGRGEIYRQPVQTSIFDVIGEPEPGPAQIAPNTPDNALAAIDNVAPQQSEPGGGWCANCKRVYGRGFGSCGASCKARCRSAADCGSLHRQYFLHL